MDAEARGRALLRQIDHGMAILEGELSSDGDRPAGAPLSAQRQRPRSSCTTPTASRSTSPPTSAAEHDQGRLRRLPRNRDGKAAHAGRCRCKFKMADWLGYDKPDGVPWLRKTRRQGNVLALQGRHANAIALRQARWASSSLDHLRRSTPESGSQVGDHGVLAIG